MALALLGVSALVCVAAPEAQAQKAFDGVEINLLTRPGPVIAGRLEERGREYQEMTGATINVATVPFADLFQKLLTDWSTGTNSIDVGVFASGWAVEMATGGLLADLSDFVAKDDKIALDDIAPYFREFNQKIDGKTYLIPILLNLDLWKPGERAEGLDSAGFLAQGVPGRAAGVKDVVVGRPEPVREEALLEIEPDALDGVQLGRVGRQEDEGEIGWDAQASAGVPAGAVEDDEGMGARRHRVGELIEHQLHGGGVGDRQDQRDARVADRADGAEQVHQFVAEVAPATRPHPLGEPAAADPTGLADPAFIQEPDLERHLRSQLAVAGDQRREGFF